MARFESFEGWFKEKYGSQAVLAEKLGVAQNTVSQWLTGKTRISPEIQKACRKLGYDGPWPEPLKFVTREDLDAAVMRIEQLVHWSTKTILDELKNSKGGAP